MSDSVTTPDMLRKYLKFLERQSTEILSRDVGLEEDLQSLNLEINKLVERLTQGQDADQQLVDLILGLKLDVDESKPGSRSGLLRWLLYYALFGWLFGFMVCAGEESESQKRKRNVEEFRSKLRTIWADEDKYGLLCKEQPVD